MNTPHSPLRHPRGTALVGAAALSIIGSPASAVTAEHGGRWVRPDETLVLRLQGDELAQWRRWRVFLGSSEVTVLLRADRPDVLELTPWATRWAVGEGDLVVYDGGDWRELARLPVRVLGGNGFEDTRSAPRLTAQLNSRAAEGRSDGQPTNPRGRYADTDVDAGVTWRGTRTGMNLQLEAHVVGSSHRGKALRAGELGDRAPKLDLADFRVALGDGTHRLELGHLSAGSHPLLAQGFASRGVGMTSRIASQTDLSMHVLHGAAVVGWDRFTGLEEPDHQMRLLTLGRELVPARPGGLRIEGSVIDASVVSQAGFNTGMVPDAERSRGLGLRLLGQSESGRTQGELAFARSRFVNPFDPALALQGELRPVQATTRNAWLASLQLGLLRQAPVAGKALDLTLELRHERADPLYRSLAASVAADQAASRAALQAMIAGASARLQWGSRVDNLDRLANVLRTRTDEWLLSMNLPLPQWLAAPTGEGAAGWPTLAWNAQRTHQHAVNDPATDASGIAASHRPDQVDGTQQLDLQWTYAAGTLGYGLARSSVDNRQPGRERADFRRLAHRASLNHAFGESVRLALGLTRSRQFSVETGLTRHNTGGTMQIDWQIDERWSASAQFNHDVADDSLDLAQLTHGGAQVQLTRRFKLAGWHEAIPGQVFVRAAEQRQRQRDVTFGLDQSLRSWWVDLGLSINFE